MERGTLAPFVQQGISELLVGSFLSQQQPFSEGQRWDKYTVTNKGISFRTLKFSLR